jgi:hypothetical protein
MTSHGQQRSRKPKRGGDGDSASVAKMGMIGTIGAAVVTAITTIVLGVGAINPSGTQVTLTGSAQNDVDSVVVLIGPRQSGGQYRAASANVVNQQWKAAVATDPHVPEPYEIKAYYRQHVGSGVQGASYSFLPGPLTRQRRPSPLSRPALSS